MTLTTPTLMKLTDLKRGSLVHRLPNLCSKKNAQLVAELKAKGKL